MNWSTLVLDPRFILFGFLAQLVDGMLGMAYGVTCNSFVLGMGVTPAFASMIVHAAEIPLTGISGLSHLKFGNIDWRIVKWLVITGILGGVLGAYVLSSIPGNVLKLPVAIYLFFMGVWIIWRAIKRRPSVDKVKGAAPLALAGGFFDAIGGGGWGPIVTTHLVAQGKEPRFVIGSVNLTEFFVTLAESVTFMISLKTLTGNHLTWIISLMVGGVCAAPLAASLTSKINTRILTLLVGILIMITCGRTILLALW